MFVKVLCKPQGMIQIEDFYYCNTVVKNTGDGNKMLLNYFHFRSFIVIALKGLTLSFSGKTQPSIETYFFEGNGYQRCSCTILIFFHYVFLKVHAFSYLKIMLIFM